MATLTLLAGTRTIGGTLAIVEDGDARLLFDCGLSYNPSTDLFTHVLPRRSAALAHVLRLGMAPTIPHFLHTPTAPPSLLPPLDGPRAVALSHAHEDHAHIVGGVPATVPVYATQPTASILRVRDDLGGTVCPIERPITAIDPQESLAVGRLRVRFVPVDHDAGGACGLLIETSDGVIAYSGDLRLHGLHPEWSLGFAQAARAAGARLLLIEGTNLWPPAQMLPSDPDQPMHDLSEAEIGPHAVAALGAARGDLAVVLLTPENGERVETFARAAAATGRLFAIDAAGLALANAALGRPLQAPYAVYLHTQSTLATLPNSVRAAVAEAPQVVTAHDIAHQRGSFLLRLPFNSFADLLDLVPTQGGGLLIHSNGLPLGSFDPAWDVMLRWVQHLRLRLVGLRSTGHCTPDALTRIATESGAPVVMPIHSYHPALFNAGGAHRILPVEGERYHIGALGH